MPARIETLAGEHGGEDVAGLDDADHVVDRAFADRQPRMLRFHQHLLGRRLVPFEVQPVDLGARRHDGAHGAVAEPHDAGDHAALVGFDGAVMLGLGDQHLDLLVGDLFLALAVLAEQPQNRAAGEIEQEDERQRHLGQDGHGRRDHDGDALGIAQRDLLGHEFADDQRAVGDRRHDDADAERIGKAGRHSHRHEGLAQPLAERCAGECARQHADQRDADLHGGQETARDWRRAQARGRRP